MRPPPDFLAPGRPPLFFSGPDSECRRLKNIFRLYSAYIHLKNIRPPGPPDFPRACPTPGKVRHSDSPPACPTFGQPDPREGRTPGKVGHSDSPRRSDTRTAPEGRTLGQPPKVGPSGIPRPPWSRARNALAKNIGRLTHCATLCSNMGNLEAVGRTDKKKHQTSDGPGPDGPNIGRPDGPSVGAVGAVGRSGGRSVGRSRWVGLLGSVRRSGRSDRRRGGGTEVLFFDWLLWGAPLCNAENFSNMFCRCL